MLKGWLTFVAIDENRKPPVSAARARSWLEAPNKSLAEARSIGTNLKIQDLAKR
jgi:hypothetical protein